MTGSSDDTQAGPALDCAASSGLDATIESAPAPSSENPSLDATAQSGSPVASVRTGLQRGAVVGRYVALSMVGAGAMGVVYAAYDPELDRKVALKLMLPEPDASRVESKTGQAGRTRMLREAQALAKLSHPNIVAIHDVGTAGDRVFLAMEFVAGQTLGTWLKLESRPWRQVVEVLTAAGHGLAAAHRAGLLHRDFKPDNVMLGDDGRVRVMDFGLARAQGREPEAEAAAKAALDDTMLRRGPAVLSLGVTQAGAIVGTPAYMAPELFKGETATVASDQFAYCVLLWEGLYGARPFAGASLVELVAAVVTGQVRPPPKGAQKIPRWLERVVRRGLSSSPADRHASMDDLLLAFVRGRQVARRYRIVAGLAALALVGAASEGVRRYAVRARVASCELAGQAILAESWNEGVKQKFSDGILATGVSFAPTVLEKTFPWLDKQAAEWADARTGACLDVQVYGTWSDELYERSTWCLDERRLAFEALVTELSSANETNVYKAIAAASRLRPVAPCRDADQLLRLPAPPSDREGATEIRKVLARAAALGAAGKYDDGLALAEQALEEARTLEWPPLVADAGFQVGSLLENAGRYEEADVVLADAYFDAVKSGTADCAIQAASQLVYLAGYRLARYEEAMAWARHADAALVVFGEPSGGLRRSSLLNSTAIVQKATGAYAEAQALHERALAAREAALGPNHPDVAISLNNLAAVHFATGSYATAKALSERALAIQEAALGAHHPLVASGLVNLAGDHYSRGSYEESKALFTRALAIYEDTLGPEHPEVASTLSNLAAVHDATGEHLESMAFVKRAIAIQEARLGPTHPDVANSLINLANAHRATGDHETARAVYERALSIYEDKHGPDHADVAHPLTGLAKVALEQGRPADAIPLAERAERIRLATSAPTTQLSSSRFALARALWDASGDAGGDRVRAHTVAVQAREGYAAAEGMEAELAEVDAWINAHSVP